MASELKFVEFVLDQIENAGVMTYKYMFGEYALYSDGKIVALICDNQLFVKPTEAGRAFIGDVVEAPPYPGAKPSFLIGDRIDDREWISELIRRTEKELPKGKPKRKAKSEAKRKAKRKTKSKKGKTTGRATTEPRQKPKPGKKG